MATSIATLPVRAIKKILLDEHKRFMDSMKGRLSYLLDYDRFLIESIDEQTIEKINSIVTHDDADKFIGESRRMSLNEWIESL